MKHEIISAAQMVKPAWTVCDREVDATDVWIDEFDPENEDGADVTAYLADVYKDGDLQVVGFGITEGDFRYFRTRQWFINKAGPDPIYRIEQYEFMAPGYGDDDERDIRAEWA